MNMLSQKNVILSTAQPPMAQAPYFGSVELAGHSGLEPQADRRRGDWNRAPARGPGPGRLAAAPALEALPPQAQA